MNNIDPSASHLHCTEKYSLHQDMQQLNGHFEIHTLEWFRKNCLDQPGNIHRLCNYEIIWVKNGTGLIHADLQDYEICSKTVYCLMPGQLRHIQFSRNIEGYYISLSADFFYGTESSPGFSFLPVKYEIIKDIVIIQIDDDAQNELEEILIRMRKEFINYSSLGAEILKGLFKVFILYLSRKLVVKQYPLINRRDKDLVRKFTLLLKVNFTAKKMVADYASELNVTPSYLNQVVKKVSGFTASYHIQQYLILEAKRQAIHFNRSMKEVAYALGFDDIAHFSKFFKNNSGVNFTSFKKGAFCA